MISKKQMILSKVRMDIEKKLEQGETVGFNVPITTTTTGSSHNCEDNKVLKKRKLSLDTSVAVVGAVSVDDIMTPKDHIHPSEFTQDSSTMMISSSSSSSSTTTMTTVLPLSAVHPAVATAAVVSAVKSTRNNNNNNSVGRPRANSGATTNNSRSRRSSSNGVHSSAVASAVIQQHQQQQQQQHGCAAGQVECCIKGCDNPVTNRLRFSLRCLSEDDFKPEFIQKSFNKVCHYHYFADLYRYKKANKAKNNGAATTTGATTGATTTTTTTSVTTTTGAVGAAVVGVNQQKKKSSNDATKKRSRNDFEQQHQQGVTSNSKPSALSLPTSVSHAALFNPSLFAALAPQTSLPPMMSVPSNTKLPVVSFASNNNSSATSATPLLNQCKAVTPVSCQDASVFFNFVGLGQVPTNTFQTRAM